MPKYLAVRPLTADETAAVKRLAHYDFHRTSLSKDDAKQLIEEVLAQVLGGPYTLVCIIEAEKNDYPDPNTVVAFTPRPHAATMPAPPTATDEPPVAANHTAAAPSASAAPPDDAPPWDDTPAPAPAPPRATRQTGAHNAAAPEQEPASPPTPEASARPTSPDERYITAVKNIFSAVEIKPTHVDRRPKW